MRITLLAVGQTMPDWVDTAVKHYQQRFHHPFNLSIKTVKEAYRSKNYVMEQACRQEADALLNQVPKLTELIALDRSGKMQTSEALAQQLEHWQQDNQSVCFLIGGPDGLDQTCIDEARQIWSFSPMTFPHPLARIILLEQLYRASRICSGHPYHR